MHNISANRVLETIKDLDVPLKNQPEDSPEALMQRVSACSGKLNEIAKLVVSQEKDAVSKCVRSGSNCELGDAKCKI